MKLHEYSEYERVQIDKKSLKGKSKFKTCKTTFLIYFYKKFLSFRSKTFIKAFSIFEENS